VHVPQWIKVPHSSPAGPHPTWSSSHVRGVHRPVLPASPKRGDVDLVERRAAAVAKRRAVVVDTADWGVAVGAGDDRKSDHATTYG
jgi:hypothetical protein